MPIESILISMGRIGLVLGSLLSVLTLMKLDIGPNLAQAWIFCCLVVLLAGIDHDDLILPERPTLPGFFVGLAPGGLRSWFFPDVLVVCDCGLL